MCCYHLVLFNSQESASADPITLLLQTLSKDNLKCQGETYICFFQIIFLSSEKLIAVFLIVVAAVQTRLS